MSERFNTLRELVEAKGITRDELLQEYSDMYKALNGIRPRWNYHYSLDDLIDEMEMLARVIDRERKREEARKREEKRGTMIRCAALDAPSNLFTVGKVYHRGENWLLEDDLGHARFVHGDEPRFLIGSFGAVAQFAWFEIVEEN